MSGARALRVIAFMSISIGVGILSHAAWGFVAFGILVLIDSFIFKSEPPVPSESPNGNGLVGSFQDTKSPWRFDSDGAAARGECRRGGDRAVRGGGDGERTSAQAAGSVVHHEIRTMTMRSRTSRLLDRRID